MATLFGIYPFLKKLFADSGYQGPLFAKRLAKILPHVNIEIVKRSDHAKGFVVLPKRWIVERTIRVAQSLPKAWPRIGRISTAEASRSYVSRQSASCSENYAIQPDVSGQTLRQGSGRGA